MINFGSTDASRQAAVEQGVEQIKAADPNFDVQAFLAATRTCFLRIKQALQERDLRDVRGYLDDTLFITLQSRVADLQEQGVRSVLEGLRIRQQRMVDAGAGDHVAVRFDGIAAHYALDDAGRLVFGEREPKAFTEFWTFTRPAGSRSFVRAECPTCDAPMDADGTGRCRHCGSVQAAGTLGWRASKIQDEVDGN